MVNLTPIPTRIQERMREKMDALGRDTPYFPDSESPILTQEKMLSRSPFMKMVSGQKHPVILMGGELISGNTDSEGNSVFGFAGDHLAGGFDEIYGSRFGDNEHRRPMPGIKSMSATFQGGMAARREATISWTCWSFEDINRLMPHFLAHGKTVMIQWGWVYDKNSLTKIPTFTDGKNKIEASAFNSNYLIDVIDADGDFDMMTGVIKNFSFTARQDGGFDCETIITSIGINILKSTEGTVSSIDPVVTYNLSSKESDEKKQFIIKEATDEISEDENNKLIRLNSSISLKIFLRNINHYVFQEMQTKNPENHIEFTEYKSLTGDKVEIRYTPNKFLRLYQGQAGDDPNNLKQDVKASTFVRWGWFEDNILSKFLSVTNKDGTVVSEFRSIERELDGGLKPKLEDGKPIFNSTKIKSHPEMQTVSINDYILPGKFSPQSEKIVEKIFGEDVTFPGDKDAIIRLAKIVDDNFSKFDVPNVVPYQDKETMSDDEMLKQNESYFKEHPDMKGKHIDVRRKHYQETYGPLSNISTNLGYMRNMLINTKLIKEAFGVGGSFGVESINIFESIQNLFELLNQRIPYWDFELVSDEVDTHRLKIIDETTTWIDFGKPPTDYTTKFSGTNVIGKPGIFYFPVWKHNSIVKNQNLQAKIPNAMQLAAMYGANLDSTTAQSATSFQEVVGAAAGGLFNDEEDTRNKGLDLAYMNENTEKLGTVSGEANEKLSNDGDDIKTYITEQSATLSSTLQDDLNELSENMLAQSRGGNEAFFNPAKPPPFFDKLTEGDRKKLFTSNSEEDDIELADNYKQLFSSKYDKDGNMRNAYIGTINALISFWDVDDNNRDHKPLKMLFDLDLAIDGIGGIVPGNSFHSSYLPQKYQEACVFQATNVEHTVDSSGWTSNINGVMRSTLGYVFDDTETADEETKEQLENFKGQVSAKKKKKAQVTVISEQQKWAIKNVSDEKYKETYGTDRYEDSKKYGVSWF